MGKKCIGGNTREGEGGAGVCWEGPQTPGELGGEGYGVVWRKSSAGPVNRSVTQRLQVGGVLRPAGIHQH